MKVCIITFPLEGAGVIPLKHLVDILCEISSKVSLISGDAGYEAFSKDKRVRAHNVEHVSSTSLLMRVMNYVLTQLKISYRLLRVDANVCLFFIGGEGLLLPMMIARSLRKKVVLALAGNPAKGSKVKGDPLTKATAFLSRVGFFLANRIIVYSMRIAAERGLHGKKTSVAHEHFVDFNKFRVTKPINVRDNVVGYIGRLSEEKGFLNFLEAIPLVPDDVKFLIAGSGVLHSRIPEGTKYLGWIPHERLPKYLNRLKLLVLPSYTEGLPNVILEAMACGTPVLTTSVGAIPDIIRDSETGFILADNSSECIVEGIDRVMNCPNLGEVVKNARKLVEREFDFEAAVEGYRRALEQ